MGKLGIMGGTFDPIHHGHLVAASEVQAKLGLDGVVFVPAGAPSHKLDKKIAPAEDRYLMAIVATASNPTFTVSRVDIDRDKPTYTVDTLRDLQLEHPNDELYFITGADVIAEIPDWENAEGLYDLAHFVGCTRPGYKLPADAGAAFPAGRVSFVEVPALSISSTEIRDRCRNGEPIWYLVSDGVVQFIGKHKLYC